MIDVTAAIADDGPNRRSQIRAARSIEEVSIGDYVLSGGEVAAMVLIDACVRLLPGVMGAAASGAEESFADGLLEYPQYTRPQLWEDRPIPEILLSGDHVLPSITPHRCIPRHPRPDLRLRVTAVALT